MCSTGRGRESGISQKKFVCPDDGCSGGSSSDDAFDTTQVQAIHWWAEAQSASHNRDDGGGSVDIHHRAGDPSHEVERATQPPNEDAHCGGCHHHTR